MIGKEKFGAFIRREREVKELGLREMAKMIEVSPTYLSKCERDEFPPPAEDKVRKIAKIIGCDVDDLLAHDVSLSRTRRLNSLDLPESAIAPKLTVIR